MGTARDFGEDVRGVGGDEGGSTHCDDGVSASRGPSPATSNLDALIMSTGEGVLAANMAPPNFTECTGDGGRGTGSVGGDDVIEPVDFILASIRTRGLGAAAPAQSGQLPPILGPARGSSAGDGALEREKASSCGKPTSERGS